MQGRIYKALKIQLSRGITRKTINPLEILWKLERVILQVTLMT